MPGISTKIREVDVNSASEKLSFKAVNVYDKVVREAPPFLSYKGDVRQLADIKRETDTLFIIRKFKFSSDGWDALFGSTYNKHILPEMEKMKIGETKLWNLVEHREVIRDDFELRYFLERSVPCLFISKNDDHKEFYFFYKRPSKTIEDSAVFIAAHYYSICGVKVPDRDKQQTAGKNVMIQLMEAHHNKRVPQYLSQKEIKNIASFINFRESDTSSYSTLVTKYLKDNFIAAKEKVSTTPFGTDDNDDLREFDPRDIDVYIKQGYIFLTELMAVGVDSFLKQIKDQKQEVEIQLDCMSQFIKGIEARDGVLYVHAYAKQEVIRFDEVMNSDNIIVVYH